MHGVAYAGRSLRARCTGGSLRTDCARRTRFALRSLRAYRTGRSLRIYRTGRSLRTDRARRTRFALRSLRSRCTGRSLRTDCARRTC